MGFFKNYLIPFFVPDKDVVTATEKLSISDGSFWAVYSSMTTPFLVPFSLLLLGVNAPIGYITGIPVFLVPLAQFVSVKMTRRSDNLKDLTVMITFLDRLLWIPVVLLIFVPGYFDKLVLILILLSLRTFFASASSTTWTLWVPTIIPEGSRNRYFAKRNFVMKIFSLIGYFIALLIFAGISDYTIAIATVFLTGVLIFSSISLMIMTRMPIFSLSIEDRTKGGKIRTEFKSFIFFIIIFYVGSSMVMPYFQLYMISSNFLNLSASVYTFIFILVSVSAIISQLYWGKFADKYGLRFTILLNLGITLLSTLLIIMSTNFFDILVPSILIGVTQSGLGLTLFNEMIGRSVNTRIRSISFYNLFQSLASASGPILANLAFVYSSSDIRMIFIISFILVLVSFLYFVAEKTFTAHRDIGSA